MDDFSREVSFSVMKGSSQSKNQRMVEKTSLVHSFFEAFVLERSVLLP